MVMDNIQEEVNMWEIIDDIRNTILQNAGLTYKLRHLGNNIWTLRIKPHNGNSARVEIIVDEYADPEERGARGAVYRYGDVPRDQVAMVMDSIMERI